MALIKCNECGKDVSTQAKKCPSCGAKVQLPKPPKRPTSSGLKYLLIAAVSGSFLLVWIGGRDNREAKVAEEKRVEALTPAERTADAKVKQAAAAAAFATTQKAATEKAAADALALAASKKEDEQKKVALNHAGEMLDKLKASLLDPESAKIKRVNIDSKGDLLCVRLLSKNAYGAYTGEQTLAVSWRLGRVKSAACYTPDFQNHNYRFKSMETAGVFGD